MGRSQAASIEYLEALKLADAAIVPAEHADEIRQMYEPLIEAQAAQTDEVPLKRLCDSVNSMLMRKDWRENLYRAREQMQKQQENDLLMPIADVILQAQSSQVLESINLINQLARAGKLRSAMDEAFHAIAFAPTYLPLHTLMGDLLVRATRASASSSRWDSSRPMNKPSRSLIWLMMKRLKAMLLSSR